MPRIRLARLEEVPEEGTLGVKVDGNYYLISRMGGEINVFEGRCTHMKGPLKVGKVIDGSVKCPIHGARFDLRSGVVTKQVAIPLIGKAKDLRKYPVAVQDGEIYIKD